MWRLLLLLAPSSSEESRTNLGGIVVTVDVDGGRHQHRRQDHQAQGEAAQAGWELLLGTDWKNQLLLEKEKDTHTHTY